MPHTGTVIKWFTEKGYGFIRPDDGTQDVFFHIRDIRAHAGPPAVGDRLRYRLSLERDIRLKATAVHFESDNRYGWPHLARRLGAVTAPFVAISYFAALALLARHAGLPVYVPASAFILSVLSWLLYAADKKKALRNEWRTDERVLHALSLLGGWPGALLAQRYLRHKSSKRRFQVLFYLTVVLNIAGIYFLGT